MVQLIIYLATGVIAALAISGYQFWVFKAAMPGETEIGFYNRKRGAVALIALTWSLAMVYFLIVLVNYELV